MLGGLLSLRAYPAGLDSPLVLHFNIRDVGESDLGLHAFDRVMRTTQVQSLLAIPAGNGIDRFVESGYLFALCRFKEGGGELSFADQFS